MAEYFIAPDGSTGTLRHFADGSWGTREQCDRAACARAVAKAWLAVTRESPPQLADGTALHESFYTLNEKDVEPNGHTTYGIFQLDRDDIWGRARMPEKDPLVLEDACAIFAAVVAYYKSRIVDGTNSFNVSNGLPLIDPDNVPADVWSYCAIAHNQGLGSASSGKGALGSIARYGLDWAGYRDRNGDDQNISARRAEGIYGDDVQSGGADWSEDFAAPFDENGMAIAAPLVEPSTSAALRLGGALLLLLLVALWAFEGRAPWKGIVT